MICDLLFELICIGMKKQRGTVQDSPPIDSTLTQWFIGAVLF